MGEEEGKGREEENGWVRVDGGCVGGGWFYRGGGIWCESSYELGFFG